MVKITIKHYLNTKLKPHLIMGVLKYPVYVRVTYGRKNSRFTSQWINYPISEKEFETNKTILDLVEYETQIINEILTNGKNPENANLISRLRYSTEPVSECFLGWTFDPKEAKEQILSFIIKKTELNEAVINPFVRVDYIDSVGWIDLVEKEVFNDETKQKALFLALLLDFEQEYYPVTSKEYEANGIWNFYEWRKNNGKNRFLEYAKKRKLMSIDEVEKIIELFDNDIIEWSSFDMRA